MDHLGKNIAVQGAQPVGRQIQQAKVRVARAQVQVGKVWQTEIIR